MEQDVTDRTRKRKKVSSVESFFDAISNVEATEIPAEVYGAVSRIWARVCQADWCWLWLYDRQFERWERVCHEPDPEVYADMQCVTSISHDYKSVADFARHTRKPQRVKDINDWTREDTNGIIYKVAMRDWFTSHQCESVIVVPLLSDNPTDMKRHSDGPKSIDVCGAICLHFKRVLECEQCGSDDDLLSMARQTTAKIAEVYQRQQFQLLYQINRLTSELLAKGSRTPADDRYRFLSGVSERVMAALNTRSMSVFYREPFYDRAHCIFSTGLIDSEGNQIPARTLDDATYDSGQHTTGRVFKTGVTLQVPVIDGADPAKYRESLDGKPVEGPAIVCPIPRSSSRSLGGAGPMTDGVLRCCGHPSDFTAARVRNFDSLEIQTLEFVCTQLSPILDMLSYRIAREIQVSTIKHDLTAPQPLLVNSIRQLESALGQHSLRGSPIPPHLLNDMKLAALLSTHLVGQLDADPAIMPSTPTPTFLEGDIIARVKSIFQHYAQEYRGISIRFGSFHCIPKLRVDRTLVERVFFNLITNAVKYGKRNSEVNIVPRVEPGGIGYSVDVINYGIGVREDEKSLIFRAHHRSEDVSDVALGAGLGLYIAKAAMKLQGGDLKLTRLSSPTIFTLFFPRHLRCQEEYL